MILFLTVAHKCRIIDLQFIRELPTIAVLLCFLRAWAKQLFFCFLYFLVDDLDTSPQRLCSRFVVESGVFIQLPQCVSVQPNPQLSCFRVFNLWPSHRFQHCSPHFLLTIIHIAYQKVNRCIEKHWFEKKTRPVFTGRSNYYATFCHMRSGVNAPVTCISIWPFSMSSCIGERVYTLVP